MNLLLRTWSLRIPPGLAGLLWLAGSLAPALAQQPASSANQSISSTGRDVALTNAMVPGRTRSSLASADALAAQQFTPSKSYTTRLGPIHFRLVPLFEVEFNSNVNFSPDNPISDLILRPGLTMDFDWVITEKNRLTLNIGLQYEKYLRSVDRDDSGFLMKPDTVLSYSVYTGDFIITLYDRPTIDQEPGGDPSLVNTAPYTRLANALGLSVVWDLNKLILSLVGERQDVMSLNGNFSGLNAVSYVGQFSAVYLVTPTLSAGPFAVISQTTYQEAVLNNTNTTQLGMIANLTLTRYTTLSVSGGLQVMEFADTGTPGLEFQTTSTGTIDNVTGTAGGGNFIGPFFSVGITNQLNRLFSHSLTVSLQPQASSVSNYSQVFSVNYGLTWRMNRLVDANLSLDVAHGQVSGTAPDYQRAEIKTGLTGQLTPSIGWKMELGYRLETQSEGQGNIAQTRCILGLDYAF